jgi:type II secretory pathway predicted ATPase ExeA
MKLSRFGLERRPFPASPDLACYYPATTHESALATLQDGLADGEAAVVLTAAPGLGKTLLAHALAQRLGELVEVCLVAPASSRAGILQALLFDLGLPHEGRPEQEMRLAVLSHLLALFREGRRTILIADESHLFTVEALEEMRLLGNVEGPAGKAVQLVLIGQPELLELLQRPELSSLRQRVAARARLEPLGMEEAADYILHHLRAAGARPEKVISQESLQMLARASGGVPRRINQAAHLALRLADAGEADQVDAEAVLESISQLGLPGGAAEASESSVLLIPPTVDDAGFRLYTPGRPA